MSAIAGFRGFGSALSPDSFLRRMLTRLAPFGPDDTASSSTGEVSFGRCLYRRLAEDTYDRQPLTSDDGATVMVADVRLDNRENLLSELAWGAAAVADAQLLFGCWLRWREAMFDKILGDFAFAVWDGREQTMILARDTAGERPLHYCLGPGYHAFASMPQALANLPGQDGAADPRRMAEFVADLPPSGSPSFYKGISRVEPGSMVVLGPGGVTHRRYWDPRGREIRLLRAEEYGEAMREQLDRAVARRLRRSRGSLGAHLSSGFDSSAVSTSAASLLKPSGEPVHSFTSAPHLDFSGPVPPGRFADESALAAATAALYTNLNHHAVRVEGVSALKLLERDHREAGQPVGHVCNNIWYTAIQERARDSGVSVMLTGEAGNFTLSAGLALDQLPDFLRAGRISTWAREVRALVRNGYSWKNIANASAGPWLPKAVYFALRRLQTDYASGAEDLTFVAPAWKSEMARLAQSSGWEVKPARNSKDRRWNYLQTYDPGNYRKRSLARWGIEERDPTADRALVEFCFSLPAEAYLKDGVRRPAMRHALATRLPSEVMNLKLRGYQLADWYEHITAEEVRSHVRRLQAHGDSGIVDLQALEAAAASWPTDGWANRPIIYFYRSKLLRAISAENFINSARRGEHG